MLRRQPGLRQPALDQQLPQPSGVGAVGLSATFAPAQRAGFHRLGQMPDRAATLKRPTHNSQPVHASTATCTTRPGNPATHSSTAAGVDSSCPRNTSPVAVSNASTVICRRCTSNPATTAPGSSPSTNCACVTAPASRPPDAIPSPTVGPPIQMAGGAGCNRARLQPKPFDTEDRPPADAHPRRHERGPCPCHLLLTRRAQPRACFGDQGIMGAGDPGRALCHDRGHAAERRSDDPCCPLPVVLECSQLLRHGSVGRRAGARSTTCHTRAQISIARSASAPSARAGSGGHIPWPVRSCP